MIINCAVTLVGSLYMYISIENAWTKSCITRVMVLLITLANEINYIKFKDI